MYNSLLFTNACIFVAIYAQVYRIFQRVEMHGTRQALASRGSALKATRHTCRSSWIWLVGDSEVDWLGLEAPEQRAE
jgi:hypothetical protein